WGVAHGTLTPAAGAEAGPAGGPAWIDPPQWPAAASQVFEPGDEMAVGQAVRQQYGAVRDEAHPGAFQREA
ncbi:sugar kinase, partial [Streptomyces inhibens]